ncbi:armadillo-type protein [Mycena olivaceomarginata]|nr:armadillo-type protein [Mycena olivaceomarginata]
MAAALWWPLLAKRSVLNLLMESRCSRAKSCRPIKMEEKLRSGDPLRGDVGSSRFRNRKGPPRGPPEDMNVAVQRAITQKLNNFTRAPEYIVYLAYVLTALTQEEDRIRTIAGYLSLLKNNTRLVVNASPEVGAYVKAAVLHAFTDESIMICNTLEPHNYLQQLMSTLDSTELSRQEARVRNSIPSTHPKFAGHIQCPRKVLPRKMDVEINGTRPPAYDDPSVRRHVCQALVLLLAARPEKLMPEMANVAEYMLYSAKDKNENVALEACEFWLTFAEDADVAMHLHPLLGKFVPVLLDCMVYGEDDLLWLEGNAEDAAIPDKDDKDTDIKPRYYGGGKSHGLERDANGNPAAPKTRIGVYCEEIASDEEDDYDRLCRRAVDRVEPPQVPRIIR